MNIYVAFSLVDYFSNAVYQIEYQELGHQLRSIKNKYHSMQDSFLETIDRTSEQQILHEIAQVSPIIKEQKRFGERLGRMYFIQIPTNLSNHYYLKFRTPQISEIFEVTLEINGQRIERINTTIIPFLHKLHQIEDPHIIPFYLGTKFPLSANIFQNISINIKFKYDTLSDGAPFSLYYNQYGPDNVAFLDPPDYDVPFYDVHYGVLSNTYVFSGLAFYFIVQSQESLKKLKMTCNEYIVYVPLTEQLNDLYIFRMAKEDFSELDRTINLLAIRERFKVEAETVSGTKLTDGKIFCISGNIIRHINHIMGLAFCN